MWKYIGLSLIVAQMRLGYHGERGKAPERSCSDPALASQPQVSLTPTHSTTTLTSSLPLSTPTTLPSDTSFFSPTHGTSASQSSPTFLVTPSDTTFTTSIPSHIPVSPVTPRIIGRDSSSDDLTHSLEDMVFSPEAVMIACDAGESYNTAATLLYCRRRILNPRDFIISLLGYRSWSVDGADQTICCRFFNLLHFLMILTCLCAVPVFQYNICLRRDEGIATKYNNYHPDFTSVVMKYSDWDWDVCDGNVVFVYIIPGLLFFLAYLVASIILRFGETEHLQTLPERVFLLSSCSPWELAKQRKLWLLFLGWLLLGGVCLAMSLTALILHRLAASHITYVFIFPRTETQQTILCAATLGLLWFQDMVLVVGVLLYCTQCHLLSRLLHIIRKTIYNGATPLLTIKRQIDETSRFLRHLNQELGLSVGVFLCLIAFRTTTGAITLFSAISDYFRYEHSGDEDDENKMAFDLHYTAMIVNLVPWLLMLLMPLFTAARVTSSYRALCKAGSQLHGRPFGYQSTPQTDIDSFLLYVSSLHLQAKILWVPIRTYFIVAIVILSAMSFMILGYLYF